MENSGKSFGRVSFSDRVQDEPARYLEYPTFGSDPRYHTLPPVSSGPDPKLSSGSNSSNGLIMSCSSLNNEIGLQRLPDVICYQ